jgi:hypothetical protein
VPDFHQPQAPAQPVPDFLQPTAPTPAPIFNPEPAPAFTPTPAPAPAQTGKKAKGEKKGKGGLIAIIIAAVLVVALVVCFFLFGEKIMDNLFGSKSEPTTVAQVTENTNIPPTAAPTTEATTEATTESTTEAAPVSDLEKAKLVFDAATSVFADAQASGGIAGTNNQGFTVDDGSELGAKTKDALQGDYDYSKIVILANENGVVGAFYNGYLYDANAGQTYDYTQYSVEDILGMLG